MLLSQYGALFGAPFDASGFTASNFQTELTALAGGRIVLAWTDRLSLGVSMQIFGADGAPQTGVIQVLDADRDGNVPSIAALADGTFLVTSATVADSGTDITIETQRFSAQGERIDSPTIIFNNPNYAPILPNSKQLANGNVVTVFEVLALDGSGLSSFVRVSRDSGHPISTAFVYSQTPSNEFSFGVPVALDDGGFAITWRELSIFDFDAVMLRLFDADGTPRGNQIEVSQNSLHSHGVADIAVLTDGRLVVTWVSDGPSLFDDGVFARILSPTGEFLSDEFRVNAINLDVQLLPSVAATPDGGFVIGWQNTTGLNMTEIQLQSFDSSGQAVANKVVYDQNPEDLTGFIDLVVSDDGVTHLSWVATNPEFFDQDGRATVALASSGIARIGTEADEELVGTPLADQLLGEAGNDILFASAGADVLDGGNGIDGVDYSAALSAVSVDLRIESQAPHLDLGLDSLRNIENIIGSEHKDTLTGDGGGNLLSGLAGKDVLNGLAGDDTLDGGAGNDVLFGGTGDDLMIGGAGNDTYFGNAGTDSVSYHGAVGAVSVSLSGAARSVGSGQGIDTFAGIEGLIGSGFADTLSGDARANVLSGGNGRDTLLGDAGNDTLRGDDGADRLEGGSGHDTIYGGLGADLLLGGLGDDVMLGENGADNLFGGQGKDEVAGGAGVDRLWGNRDDDMLSGGLGQDELRGGSGNDLLFGGLAKDQLFGDAGNDRLEGEDGNDVLKGGQGADVLLGGDGQDTLDGGGGNDALFGGADGLVDSFVFAGGYGADAIRDFEVGIDKVDLSRTWVANYSELLTIAQDRAVGVRLDFGSNDVLVLDGLSVSELIATDFIFS
ncbi:MAG: calcium-binding protein [Aliishimia sp.]